ncbi:hydrogenase expression/formation protein HypC [Rhodobacter aestuarii]|uniref:Hydrogenase expression/formation protein HypC n=1 Tax=Rhodobacter aestuarii TaxID=453582 RepID=A0A1N7KYX3_9RHOB|nr:HypC/HybG/HupF family hydrogenase formation chaperone [Rhodobacter aestuarii]PTV95490.1 hydrogenase expression/formation protein HypC [Rhodobacter aestuarii]SIS66819.1 hydrogenase expression/formation protein HypC [Rhodobacter aestuarii]
MCVGVPVQLIAVDGIRGDVIEDGVPGMVDLSLTPEAQPGDWILAFLGAAREVISAEEAEKISAALGGLRSLMQGGDLGEAFADLESRSPQLPPHLQAALDAGKTTA